MNKDMTGAGERSFQAFGPVKREAGARPARSRRCKRGVLLPPSYGNGTGSRGVECMESDVRVRVIWNRTVRGCMEPNCENPGCTEPLK